MRLLYWHSRWQSWVSKLLQGHLFLRCAKPNEHIKAKSQLLHHDLGQSMYVPACCEGPLPAPSASHRTQGPPRKRTQCFTFEPLDKRNAAGGAGAGAPLGKPYRHSQIARDWWTASQSVSLVCLSIQHGSGRVPVSLSDSDPTGMTGG